MSAGTLTLTTNSASVYGSGTSFTTELAAADFIVVTVGGIPYTLSVKTVDSATSLTLVSNFTGPTQSGAAWYAVPRVAMNLVSAAMVVQNTEALRGLNYDKQNWQQIFSGSGTATVKIPDGSSFTGPTWNSLATSLDSKATKGANGDITSLTGLTTPLSKEQGGTGLNSPFGSAAGTFCQGNDARIGTVDGKIGGTVQGTITLAKADSTWSYGLVLTALANQEGARFRSANITSFNDSSSRVVTTIDSVGNRLSTLYPTGGIICKAGTGAANPQLNSYSIAWTGSQATLYIDNSLIGAISVAAVSDRELKEDIEYITNLRPAATEVMKWRVASFKYKARGIIPQSDEKLGFIANDLVQVSPECVKGEGLAPGNTDENATTAYYLDPIAMLAKLTLAIQAQQKQISELQSIVKQLSAGS